MDLITEIDETERLNGNREEIQIIFDFDEMLENCIMEGEMMNWLGVSNKVFGILLDYLDSIHPKSSNKKKLAIMLYYMRTGFHMKFIADLTGYSSSSISRIVMDCASAISELAGTQIRMPKTREQVELMEAEFEAKQPGLRCFLCLAGKKWTVSNASSHFFGSFDTFIGCDAHMRVRYTAFVRFANSDVQIFNGSHLKNWLDTCAILPGPRCLQNSQVAMPAFVLADESFLLSRYLMKPYTSSKAKGIEKICYNCILSSVRSSAEKLFDIITTRHKLLKRPMDTMLQTSEKIVLSAFVIQNLHVDDDCEFDDLTVQSLPEVPYSYRTPEEQRDALCQHIFQINR